MTALRNTLVSAAFMVGVSLSGCNGDDHSKEATRKARNAQREQAVQAAMNAGPKTRSWQTTEGTVIELTIPKVSMLSGFLETQRCIVWRDAVTKTSSLTCEREETDLRNFEGDPPEVER